MNRAMPEIHSYGDSGLLCSQALEYRFGKDIFFAWYLIDVSYPQELGNSVHHQGCFVY